MRGLLAAHSRSVATAAASRGAPPVRSISSGCLRSSASSSDGASGGWTDETPQGGNTELWVYRPESHRLWPDPALGILSAADPKFVLPGNVGTMEEEVSPMQAKQVSDTEPVAVAPQAPVPDVLARPTNIENQAQVLYTAADYLKSMEGADTYACAGLLEELPSMRLAGDLRCGVHPAPQLLRKEAAELFLDQRNALLSSGMPLTVLTLAQRTQTDMSMWSDEIEEERDQRMAAFVGAAKEICARLTSEGFWADFIDPSSGTPFYGKHSATTMFETDEKYRLLGYRVEDLGCCKVLCDRDFGRHVMVGSIFTTAHATNTIIEEVLHDLRLLGDANGAM